MAVNVKEPEVNFEPEEETLEGQEYELVSEPVVEDEIDPRVAELEALKAQVAQKTSVDEQISRLAELLGKGVEQKPVYVERPAEPAPTVPAPIDYNAVKKKIGEKLFDDPGTTFEEAIYAYLGPFAQQVSDKLEQVTVASGQLQAMQDPGLKDVFGTYGAEVEAEVKAMKTRGPLTVSTYRDAAALVKARHLDDIVAAKVAEALAKATEGQAPAAKPGVAYTGVSPTPSTPRVGPKKLYLTEEMEQEISRSTLPREQYIEKVLVPRLKAAGKLR